MVNPDRFDDRAVRRRCRELVDGLDIPEPFDVAELCRRTARRRGRPIHLVPWPATGSGLSGFCVFAPNGDWIFFEKDTTPWHQEHIILHELGHIVCDHQQVPSDDDARRSGVADDLRKVLCRAATWDTDVIEREAETIADMVGTLADADRLSQDFTWSVPDGAVELLYRLDGSLGPKKM